MSVPPQNTLYQVDCSLKRTYMGRDTLLSSCLAEKRFINIHMLISTLLCTVVNSRRTAGIPPDHITI
jgi:hypothetical protein